MYLQYLAEESKSTPTTHLSLGKLKTILPQFLSSHLDFVVHNYLPTRQYMIMMLWYDEIGKD